MDCRALIVERIRQSGPLTIAGYMDLALYAPGLGYYARAAQRSGRAGDFVTSVDSGPLFGALLADHVAHLLRSLPDEGLGGDDTLDLVEVAAGNGRLSRDVLDALEQRHPDLYARVALTLVERSAEARAAQEVTLAVHAPRVRASRPDLPPRVRGVLFCNELLDAMPVHVVVMTEDGLAEVFVDLDGDRLVERLGPPSTAALSEYFAFTGVPLLPGARAEAHLAGLDWLRRAAASLDEGALVIIDYGYDAAQLYGSPHATGTLRSFHRHMTDAAAPGAPDVAPWLVEPGSRDLTTHVDLTAVRREAGRCGLTVDVDTDQTRFLLTAAERSGLMRELEAPERLPDRLALKTLLVPGGMGTTHRVLVLRRRATALSTGR